MNVLYTGGLALTALVSFLPACSSASEAPTRAAGNGSIVDTAVDAGQFTTLVTALKAAKLVETLEGPGPFTVFAPTDEAFAKLPAGTVERLLEPKNAQELASVLTYHVVAGDVRAAQVAGLTSAEALNGQRLPISAGQGVTVAGARVVTADIVCRNGVIHVVDRVMLPASKDVVATAVDAGQFKILAQALGAAGLTDALAGKGPFTVFAPTDEAFARIPAEQLNALLADKAALTKVLTYHVVPGKVMASDVKAGKVATVEGESLTLGTQGGVSVDQAKVVKADIVADNGVIHVIDSVLMPN